ncbi:MAG: hypothetical protein IH991_09200 [Planctomycetes bacterium]|nr:hypothetical protein [Planctomycetota bacterium]
MLKKVPALKNVELSEEELNAAWQSLAGKDAAIANDAAWKLATAGKPALELLKERLDPTQLPKSDVDNIRRLIRELDDDKFPVREAAWKALNNEGPAALPLLEAALKQAASAEVRFRVRSLIKRLS